jgi:hypothetical protein
VSVMTARYPGHCAACQEPIRPGQLINWVRRGKTYHQDCTGQTRVNTIRFSSGAVEYRNARGRCEDAPCCGCCTI